MNLQNTPLIEPLQPLNQTQPKQQPMNQNQNQQRPFDQTMNKENLFQQSMPSYIPEQYQFSIPNYLGNQQPQERVIASMQNQINELRTEVTLLKMENDQYRTAINYLLHRMRELDNRIPRPCFQQPPVQPVDPINTNVKQPNEPLQPLNNHAKPRPNPPMPTDPIADTKKKETKRAPISLNNSIEPTAPKRDYENELEMQEKKNEEKRKELDSLNEPKQDDKHPIPDVPSPKPTIIDPLPTPPKEKVVESKIVSLSQPITVKDHPMFVEKDKKIEKLQKEYDELVEELKSEAGEISKLLNELKD